MNTYVIGIDKGCYTGDVKSLCIAHMEDKAIVIDETFSSSDSVEFKNKKEELEKKYNIVDRVNKRQNRINEMTGLFMDGKIKLHGVSVY